MTTSRQFSDLDLTFQRHPIRKDLVLSVGDIAVTRSVRNLILTNHYERPFHPEIGSNIRKLLFEHAGPVTANFIEREISDTIKNFEPRVNLQQVIVQALPDNNTYNVTVVFYIINQTQPLTINFLLQRLR